MLAKLTSKNQLTLPKAALLAVGPTQYFDVASRDGVIVLTPVRVQRGDAVRLKLAQLKLTQADLDAALDWARQRIAEPRAPYAEKQEAGAKPARKPAGRRRQ